VTRPIIAKRVVTAIHAVLNQAIKAAARRCATIARTSGELGYFQHSFQVYDREGEKCQTAGCAESCGDSPERALDLLVSEMSEMT